MILELRNDYNKQILCDSRQKAEVKFSQSKT